MTTEAEVSGARSLKSPKSEALACAIDLCIGGPEADNDEGSNAC